MKLRLIIVASVFSFLTLASEGGFKLGFVDLQKTLQGVEAGKTAKSTLEKEVTAKRTGLEKQQQHLQQQPTNTNNINKRTIPTSSTSEQS